jgi:hypothetical protein
MVFVALIAGTALWSGTLRAETVGDLRLGLELEHPSLLLFEPIHAFGKLENLSGETVVVGDRDSGLPTTLSLIVERLPREDVPERESRPRPEDLVLVYGKPETLHFDLAKWYDLARTGKYVTWIEVDWRGVAYRSNKVVFDVVRGIELERVIRSVPSYPDLQWTYSLRYWTRPHKGRNAEYLFLSVDDLPNGMNYGVFQLGRLVRVFKPEVQIDPYGLVRVVHQSGPDCFARSTLAVSSSGVYFLDQTYHLPNGETHPTTEERDSSSKVLLKPEPVAQEFFLKRWFRKRFSRTESVAE